MYNLSLYPLSAEDKLIFPPSAQNLTLESPALSVMTDFRHTAPLVIDASTKASMVEHMMLQAHVRMKLVVDSNNRFLGMVSLSDISQQAIMQKVNEGFNRDDLLVTDFMLPRNKVKAFSLQELEHARIADVIKALESNGQQHCLVIDTETHSICGLISASDIARKLRLNVDINRGASFIDIFEAVTDEL
jgi:CBS domain containing-hemolysin-like protein